MLVCTCIMHVHVHEGNTCTVHVLHVYGQNRELKIAHIYTHTHLRHGNKIPIQSQLLWIHEMLHIHVLIHVFRFVYILDLGPQNDYIHLQVPMPLKPVHNTL